jgi:hypothetical protein
MVVKIIISNDVGDFTGDGADITMVVAGGSGAYMNVLKWFS